MENLIHLITACRIDMEIMLRKDVAHIVHCYDIGLTDLVVVEAEPNSCYDTCHLYAQIVGILTEDGRAGDLVDMTPLIDEYLEYVTFRS